MREGHIQSREAEIGQILRTIGEESRTMNLREDDLRHKLAAVREKEETLKVRDAELQEMEGRDETSPLSRWGPGC